MHLVEANIWDSGRSDKVQHLITELFLDQLLVCPVKSKIHFPNDHLSFSAISLPKKRARPFSTTLCVLGRCLRSFPFLSSIPPAPYADLNFCPGLWGSSDLTIFYLSIFVKANIQQLWSIAELQFSGSRRILIQEGKSTMLLGGKRRAEKKKKREKGLKKPTRVVFKNKWENR